MKISKLIGLSLLVIGINLFSCVNTYAVTIDNDGKARDTPYGDSKLPTSYVDTDYYDCYMPYALTPKDIGGYANGYTFTKSQTYTVFMKDDKLSNPFSTYFSLEFDRSGSSKWGLPITADDTKMNIVTDKNGNQYYISAIQKFYYNFGGLNDEFPSWDRGTLVGQLFDVILTDGTCIHFVVGDANAVGHTNGGPSTRQDVSYLFTKLKLPQYKNLYHAQTGNTLELWTSNTTGFIKKYNTGNGEGKNQIAYYRMYNAKIDDNPPKRASGVGKEPSYNMGNVTISASASASDSASDGNTSNSAIVDEWELEGMPAKSTLADTQEPIELPTKDDLSISERLSLSTIEENRRLETEAKTLDTVRVGLAFIGLCILCYSTLLLLAMVFDRVNSVLEISLVGVLTLGKLRYHPSCDEAKELGQSLPKGYISSTKLLKSIGLFCIVGFIILSGSLYRGMIEIIIWVLDKLSFI